MGEDYAASDNYVTVNGGSFQGRTYISAGLGSLGSDAVNNRVTVNDGEFETGIYIFGGRAYSTGNTDNNTVTVSSGTIGGNKAFIWGGMTMSNIGNATGNKIAIYIPARLKDVYGWGGMEESVDCSSFVQDVYRSMGILLPRDADQQELAMNHSVSLEGLNTDARYQKAAEAPVGALFFKPGHVMLYLGKDAKGTPLAIHSASSYFTFSGNKSKKHYIRRVLVSDLSYQNGKAVRTIDGMTSIGSCF